MKEQDLTKGNILKVLLLFTIPISLTMLSSQLYSFVDTIIIGQLLNADSLAAVSNATTIILILLFISGGIELGGGILIASNKSKLNQYDFAKLAYTIIFIDLIVGMIMTLMGIFFFKNLLQLVNTPIEIIDQANTYGFYYLIGLPFVMLYFIMQEMVIGYGDSKTPMKYVIFTSLLNIVLDYLLINLMGIGGAALASAISQIIGAILISRQVYSRLIQERFHFSMIQLKYVKEIIQLSVPNMIQQATGPLISMVKQALLGMIGVGAIAGVSCSNKITSLFMIPLFGISHGLSVVIAQNYNAGENGRVEEAKKYTYFITTFYAIFVISVCLLFGKHLIHLFTDDTDAVKFAMILLTHEPFVYIATAIRSTNEAVMKGYKKMNSYLFSNLSYTIGFAIIASRLVPTIGFNGFYYSSYISGICALIISIICTRRIEKKIKKT